MKTSKSGGRHTLLLYRRSMDRLWKIILLLGILLAFAWGWTLWESRTISIFSTDTLLLAGAIVAFMLALFFFLARFRAYVQPYPKYVKMVTPFLRMNISYRRMRSVRPDLVAHIFPKSETSRSQQRSLEPFYGKTAIVMELKGYPLDQTLLKIFLPSVMFSPQFTGLVLIIPDWMQLSTEIESFRGSQRRSIKDQAWAEEMKGW